MSLLELDLENATKYYNYLKKFSVILMVLSYAAGIVYFCLLPHESLVHGTYISENALLPGLVNSEIYSADGTYKHYDELKSIYEEKKEIDLDHVRKVFAELGTESYFQHFNVTNPLNKHYDNFKDEKNIKKGKNVYALGRAQRADGTESIVITAPTYIIDNNDKRVPNLVGIAFLFTLAELSVSKPYWAKDLIFVVSDMNHIGIQAWINSYFEIESEYIRGENLQRRGGAIQAALNLEFKEVTINKLEIKLEGPNGKLPNLDLFNSIIRVCKANRFECSLESEKNSLDFSYHQKRPPAHYETGVKNLFQMVFRQASGLPSSIHGYFLNHRIEAVTISGSRFYDDKSKKPILKQNLMSAVKVVEGTLRSINNLLERFHQSFFFYLLPSSNYYISIGMYMPAFGLVALPLCLEILTIWFSMFINRNSQVKTEMSLFLFNLMRIVLSKMIIASLFGFLLYFGTSYFVYYGRKFQLNARDSLINCYIAVIVNILAAPALINLKLGIKRDCKSVENQLLQETSEKLLKLIGLLQLTIFLGTLSLMNFSLSFLIALFYVPVAILTVQSFNFKILKFVQMIALLVASPLIYFLVLYAINGYFFEAVDVTNYKLLLSKSFDDLYNIVLMSKLSNIWTYDIVNLCLIPIWTLLWFIAFPKLN